MSALSRVCLTACHFETGSSRQLHENWTVCETVLSRRRWLCKKTQCFAQCIVQCCTFALQNAWLLVKWPSRPTFLPRPLKDYTHTYICTTAFAHLSLYRHRFAYLHAYTFIYVQNCICTQISTHKCTCWNAQQDKHIHIHNQIVHLFVNRWMQICVQVYLHV